MRRKRDERRTYTKKAVKALLIVGVLNAEIPYLLAYLGREPCAELAIAWITEIVAVILGYLCKAYFETKEQEKNKLREKQPEKEQEVAG